jgi:inositol transport system ATP-binding protein
MAGWLRGARHLKPADKSMSEKIFSYGEHLKVIPGSGFGDVNLAYKGTIHALMGENGAGKSTLMKILDGIYTPDTGQITFQGQPVTIEDTHTALKLGISMIHQELSPIPYMTVAENIFLGREPLGRFGMIDKRKLNANTKALLNRLEINISQQV